MKYKIELTNKQKAQMDCIIDIVHRYVGFNPKLEPIKTTNVEDTNEYQIGYKTGYDKGFEDGEADATYNTDLIDELKQVEYIRGYNTAINDYNGMIQWLHDCRNDFKEFMNKKYGYDVMYLTNPRVDEGVMLYDLICDHDIAEVISEFQKWQEEKKKAEEEIKIGDIVITDEGIKAIVLDIDDYDSENIQADVFNENGCYEIKRIIDLKYIGATNWVLQLLDKLRGLKE